MPLFKCFDITSHSLKFNVSRDETTESLLQTNIQMNLYEFELKTFKVVSFHQGF